MAHAKPPAWDGGLAKGLIAITGEIIAQMTDEANTPANETGSDYREYIAALRTRIKAQEKRGEQTDFADEIAANGTRDQARYWLHVCLMEERAKAAALLAERDDLLRRVAELKAERESLEAAYTKSAKERGALRTALGEVVKDVERAHKNNVVWPATMRQIAAALALGGAS